MTGYDEIVAHLRSYRGAEATWPFGPQALVMKVMGKMFALIMESSDPVRINLKCEPEHALWLRQAFVAVEPGYHMNKRHWNTVVCDGSVPTPVLLEMMDHSYERVVAGLKRSDRARLEAPACSHRTVTVAAPDSV